MKQPIVHAHLFRMISAFAYFLDLSVSRAPYYFRSCMEALNILLSGTQLGFSKCFKDKVSELDSIINNLSNDVKDKKSEEQYIEDLFKWTYNLRFCVTGDNTISYDNYLKLFQNENNDIKFWSRPTWFIIHLLAKVCPDMKEERHFTAYKAFIVTLKYVIPCGRCRKHLSENLSKAPMSPIKKSCKNELFEWSYKLHIIVDKMLEKKSISFDDMDKYFNDVL